MGDTADGQGGGSPFGADGNLLELTEVMVG